MLDELNKARGNYYEHHNMPVRNVLKSSTFTSGFRPADWRNKDEGGRNLYPSLDKKREDPGPGAYQSPIRRTHSYGFISKLRPSVKLHRKMVQQQKLGPGYYNFDNIASKGFLSSNKKTPNFKYNETKQKQRLKFQTGKTPGPGRYSFQPNIQKTSRFSLSKTHTISSTKRSSIILTNQNLAPGHYDWDKFYKKQKQKKKPTIQYKFVYGHPS